MSKRTANAVALAGLWTAAVSTVAVLATLLVYVVIRGLPALSVGFITEWPSGVTGGGGIFPTIVATVYVVAVGFAIVIPIAVGAAVYLAEYAGQGRFVTVIRFAADSLASVPSIVFGLFGLAFFVYALGFKFSMLSGGLALSLMMLPLVMRTTEEAIRGVPNGYRLGSYGLGGSKWQTVRRVVLPAASPRIATGIILAIGRAAGETAVLMFTAGMAINAPIFLSDPGRTMTSHLYVLAMEGISMRSAFGTALLLVGMIFSFNLFARWLARRRSY